MAAPISRDNGCSGGEVQLMNITRFLMFFDRKIHG
jgi:hypothetical protein